MPDGTRLHRAYRRRLDRVRASALAAVLDQDGPAGAVPVVLDAQRDTVAMADGYLSLEAGLATESDTEPWGIDPDPLIGAHARHGDFLEDVYARNWAGATPQGSFAERMAREVNTDISLADRAATYVHTEGDPRIVGFRRVLGGGANCGLCVVAATQRYSRGDLRPIHHACGCTTQPIYGDAGGYRRPSTAQLQQLYDQAGGTGWELRHVKVDQADLPDVVVVETTLGPTLTAA